MMLNDTHLPERSYPGARARAEWAAACVGGGHGFEPVDFVMAGGDIIDGWQRRFTTEYQQLHSWLLKPLSVPFLPCLGNHETNQGHCPAGYAAYEAQFGPGKCNYLFAYGGIGFIVIDACFDRAPPCEVWDRCHAFLRQALESVARERLPVFIVSHVPLVPVRDEEVLVESFGFGSYYAVMDPRIRTLVGEYGDGVIAVLSGHLHLTGMMVHQGVHHLTVSGTAGYPADVATFDLFDDRVDVEVYRVPERLQDRSADIHGRPRHEIDYTDSCHPDHERYVSGNRDERSFSIPLNGPKRPGTMNREFRLLSTVA